MSSEAKNLEAISRAIDQHNADCEFPAVAIAMNPFEVERLGWDTIRGLPIRSDPAIGTGSFRVICAREMSGWRTCGSSTGSASKTISERDSVSSTTVLAISSRLISSGLPMFTGVWYPDSAKAMSPRMRSST